MVELMSFLSPMADAAAPTPKRPMLSTRRSSQGGGVAMSSEKRLPRELLKKIGIKGKEVVNILKDRDWEIQEPRGLQQQKLYYLPGAKEKVEQAKQNADFFVGEGELYAFILQQGGLRYLLPDEEFSTEDESEVEATQPTKQKELPTVDTSVEDQEESEGSYSSASATESAEAGAGTQQRKWKRRKKLSTAKNKSVEKKTPVKRRRKTKNVCEEDEEDRIRVDPRVKVEQATYGGIGQQTEFSEYESSLTARGWRAQLLQDMDVHLLRSTAAVDRRHRALDAFNDGFQKTARPTEGVGPHVQDAVEILQELEGLTHSIRASQDDLSSLMESIIAQGERLTIPDRIDPVGRLGIPGFVSTGQGSLVLMRDIERYLLLFVAAVRRYHRTRKAISANEPGSGSFRKRSDLRALQVNIEESKRELQELATIIALKATKACQDFSQDTTPSTTQSSSQSTEQSASKGTSRTTDCDADVSTDHDQSSSQQSVSSPQRLEGGNREHILPLRRDCGEHFGWTVERSGDA